MRQSIEIEEDRRLYHMTTIMKKHDILRCEDKKGKCHSVVGGHTEGKLNEDDEELYHFMVGGMQAK